MIFYDVSRRGACGGDVVDVMCKRDVCRCDVCERCVRGRDV